MFYVTMPRVSPNTLSVQVLFLFLIHWVKATNPLPAGTGDGSRRSWYLGIRDGEQSFEVAQDIPTSIVYKQKRKIIWRSRG